MLSELTLFVPKVQNLDTTFCAVTFDPNVIEKKLNKLRSIVLHLLFRIPWSESTYDFVEKSYDLFFEKNADFFDVSPRKSYILTLKKAILTIAKGTNHVFFVSLFLSRRNFFQKQNGGSKMVPASYNFSFSRTNIDYFMPV